jgi:Hemerythrin HHE cation binding domain
MQRVVAAATRAVRRVARALTRRRDPGTSPGGGSGTAGAERVTEERDAVDVLTAEHRELDAWLASVESEPGSPEAPATTGRIVVRMHAHLAAEEHTFHRHLREDVGNMAGLLDTSDGRHSTISQLLALLESADPADAAEVGRIVAALRQEFDDDVRLEEESIFPQARRALTRERLVALGRMLEE